MPLRWTVTEKWKDKWFRQLKPSYKLLWFYLLDNCDISGIIEWDIDLWTRDLGFRFNEEDIRQTFRQRILFIPKTEYIWIPKFIEIQQRCAIEGLNPENNAHKGILKTIEKYSLLTLLPLLEGANEGLTSPISNSKGTSNGKDKKIEKKTFGEFGNVLLTDVERKKLTEKLGSDERAKRAIEILSAYKKSANKHYDSDYATFHTWVIEKLEKREKEGGVNTPKTFVTNTQKYYCSVCNREIPKTFEGICPECLEKRKRV